MQFSRRKKLEVSFFILNINWEEVWRGTDLHDHHSNYSWYFSILVYRCIFYSKFKTKFFFTNFIYLFMAALSSFLHTGFLLIVMSGGYSSFGGFPGSSDAPESAYNVEKPSLSPCTGFSLWWLLLKFEDSRAWAYLLWGIWDLPGLGKDPVFSALAGRFLLGHQRNP